MYSIISRALIVLKKLVPDKAENRIGLAAFLASIYFFNSTVQHNQTVTTPVLQFSIFEGEEISGIGQSVGIKLENLGLGPAEIIISDMYVAENKGFSKPVDNIHRELKAVGWTGYAWADLHPLSFLSSTQRKNLLSLPIEKSTNWNHGKPIFYSTCYCSVYKQCFYSSTASYHTSLDSCDSDGYIERVKSDLRKANSNF